MYGDKIKMIRELRNYSQEYVADRLGIKQNSYSKIENNQTKLSAETLQKLAGILEVSPLDMINHQPAIINFQTNHDTAIGYNNAFASQKELLDKLLSSKDAEIERLQKIIEGLLKEK